MWTGWRRLSRCWLVGDNYPDQQPEISFQADRASLAMRRYLKRMADEERRPAEPPMAA